MRMSQKDRRLIGRWRQAKCGLRVIVSQGCFMFEKDCSAGTLCPIIMAKCGFGGARPPGEPPSMTQSCDCVQRLHFDQPHGILSFSKQRTKRSISIKRSAGKGGISAIKRIDVN